MGLLPTANRNHGPAMPNVLLSNREKGPAATPLAFGTRFGVKPPRSPGLSYCARRAPRSPHASPQANAPAQRAGGDRDTFPAWVECREVAVVTAARIFAAEPDLVTILGVNERPRAIVEVEDQPKSSNRWHPVSVDSTSAISRQRPWRRSTVDRREGSGSRLARATAPPAGSPADARFNGSPAGAKFDGSPAAAQPTAQPSRRTHSRETVTASRASSSTSTPSPGPVGTRT